MIPFKEDRKLISTGCEESIAFGISSKDSVHIMSILRDQLYSDKIAAVIREICANAQDANAMAGRGDMPIEVTLPTIGDPTLLIRDHGPGLSLDDVRNVFSQYGASTKRDSNDSIGMLGIGSKSPFAYSDSFVVTSWHGGSKSIYNAVIDPTGGGRIDLLDISECPASETGIEVKVAIRPGDCSAFEDRAKKILMYFEPQPKINIEIPRPKDTHRITRGEIINNGDDPYGYEGGKWVAIMGCISYPIDLSQLKSGTGYGRLGHSAQRVSGVLRFGIGELQVAASRESLKYSDSTQALLIDRINEAISEYVRTMLDGLDKQSNWEKRLRVYEIDRKGFPIPPEFKILSVSPVHLKMDTAKNLKGISVGVIKDTSLFLQCRGYNNRMTNAEGIRVVRGLRIVVPDERRAIAGYKFKQNDYIVRSMKHDDPALITAELEALLKHHLMDGIEIVLLSSVEWERPYNRVLTPRDPVKARAEYLVLEKHMVKFVDITKSQYWVTKTLTPSKDDVFVIIEGYRAEMENEQTFYDWVREDLEMAKAAGVDYPQIVGYKKSKSRPITASDCVGMEYKEWRRTEFPKILLKNSKISQLIEAMSFILTGMNLVSGSNDSQFLSDKLGANHPLITYLALEKKGKALLSTSNVELRMIAQFIVNCDSTQGKSTNVKELLDRYPLLSEAPTYALSSSNWNLWVDYIKLIDSLRNDSKNKEEQE